MVRGAGGAGMAEATFFLMVFLMVSS